ncbi:MAG: PLP-dependent transferase, partial [Gemmatimonadetes bacterium]|nr:PLP-dependent transferase [Gemmatimonadota bacterium]
MDIQTRLVHAGEERINGAVVTPIFQSSTFVSPKEEEYHDIRYLRLNNTPNHRALHAKLAAVCGGEDALVAGSGMAAITTALMTVLNSGDHLLIQDCLYGGTHSFVTQDAPGLGLSYDFIAGNAPETWAAKLRPETRAVDGVPLTHPLMVGAHFEAVLAFAREHGLVSLIDNTFASPCNFRPLEIGFDIELHSATKYLNGHSDLVAGVVVGSAAHVKAIKHKLNHLGGSLDVHACFLLQRGLKTLSLRMRQHDENGLRLAHFLAEQEQVVRVNYPRLESHPQYERAQRLFAGAGGVLSFE